MTSPTPNFDGFDRWHAFALLLMLTGVIAAGIFHCSRYW
jgi:hypothetical protein